ncbi:MAG: cation-binding protein [Elusimicrobia bacterium]|nr:cation-binding protein [Elusimicrobiota bacterium]
MKPRGPLMKEHRLIEQMIEIIKQKIGEIKKSNTIDPVFIDTAVDFIRIYADQTHHGKEEDILFRRCAKKSMSQEDTRIMHELIEEHKMGRKTVGELESAKHEYLNGKKTNDTIVEKLTALTEFYPQHIKKEDRVFFPHSETYFNEKELNDMLDEFWEFDKRMIHDKYKLVISSLKNKIN